MNKNMSEDIMIEFNDVSFYMSDKYILNNLNYSFKKGVYVIQGESGVGKTTFVNLIMNYLQPDSGMK